jgi:hypothetical protein
MSDLTYTFTVRQSPAEAFAAICDPRAWWSGQVEGRTDELGADWSYEVPDLHFSAFRITELVPDRSVAWLVTQARLTFTEDEEEWTVTTVRFDVSATHAGTRVRFTHEGLVPGVECYDVCRVAWGEYITGSLRSLIETGAGRPNSYEDLDVAREAARESA